MQKITLMGPPHTLRRNGIDDPAPTRDAEGRKIHPDETTGFPSMLVMPSWYNQYWLTEETGGQCRRGLLHRVRASLHWTHVRAVAPSPTAAAALGRQQHEPERANRNANDPGNGFGDRKRPWRTQ